MPAWWVWYYWVCPVSWTIYGLIIGQYGDVQDQISIVGSNVTIPISQYLEDHFGFETDYHGQVAAVLICFSVVFAIIYAFCIKTLNFQMR